MRSLMVLAKIISFYVLTTFLMVAGPGSCDSVSNLSGTADAIVIGPVQATLVNASVSALITVERVLKGEVTRGTSIHILWTAPSLHSVPAYTPGSGRLPDGYGMFFLKRDSGGSWSLLPVVTGDAEWQATYVPVSSSVSQDVRSLVLASVPTGASAVDLVVAELTIAAEVRGPAAFDLIDVFRDTQSPVLTAAFNRFLTNRDLGLRVIGLRGLISMGNETAIVAVQNQEPSLSLVPGWRSLLRDIQSYYVNASPSSVRNLGQIATDTRIGLDLRISTAAALARMHTGTSLPYLASLLTDNNLALASMGVGGLSSFADNVPIGLHEPAPGPWPYRTNDTIAHSAFDEGAVRARTSYYVDFWRDWWRDNQGRL